MLNRNQKSMLFKPTILAVLGFSIFFANFSAYAEFTQFDARYKVRFDKFKAKSYMTLRQNSETGEYIYTTYTKPKGIAKLFGKITESLSFDFTQAQIVPSQYRHNSRDKISIDYDWETNKAASKTDDGSEDLNLSGNELDLLSLQMQLTRDLKNDSLKPVYKVIKDNTVKNYTVTELGEDTFNLGKTSYKTIKIQQQREGSSRRSVLHFAPELDYILVQMKQFKGTKQRASFTMYGYKDLGVATIKDIKDIENKTEEKDADSLTKNTNKNR